MQFTGAGLGQSTPGVHGQSTPGVHGQVFPGIQGSVLFSQGVTIGGITGVGGKGGCGKGFKQSGPEQSITIVVFLQ